MVSRRRGSHYCPATVSTIWTDTGSRGPPVRTRTEFQAVTAPVRRRPRAIAIHRRKPRRSAALGNGMTGGARRDNPAGLPFGGSSGPGGGRGPFAHAARGGIASFGGANRSPGRFAIILWITADNTSGTVGFTW